MGMSRAKALWQEKASAIPASGRGSGGFSANGQEVVVQPGAGDADRYQPGRALKAIASGHFWNFS